jgi:hypothetical protein
LFNSNFTNSRPDNVKGIFSISLLSNVKSN